MRLLRATFEQAKEQAKSNALHSGKRWVVFYDTSQALNVEEYRDSLNVIVHFLALPKILDPFHFCDCGYELNSENDKEIFSGQCSRDNPTHDFLNHH